MIYLDNSATTKPCKKAIDNITYILNECYGNPSALYDMGFEAEQYITATRKNAAKMLNCSFEEIFFTSGGTESNNTAVFSAVEYLKKRGNRIVTTEVEHPSIKMCMKKLSEQGFEIIYLPVNTEGKINDADIRNAITKDTILVSIMMVNNETGAVQPISNVKKYIKDAGAPALFHSDAVQAFGKVNINVKALGIDLLSISGHKVHGPKGIGILYKGKDVHIPPFILGGGQENGFRSGTEAVHNIYGLNGALEEINIVKDMAYISELKSYLTDKLSEIEDLHINSPADSLPNITNFSVLGYKSEVLLHFMESKGICVSSGSACSKGKQSGVLTAMNLSKEITDSALRISFSKYNSREEIDALINCITEAKEKLRKNKQR